MVDRDPDEENYLYNKTQAMVTGQAAQKLDGWYNRDGGKHHPKTIGPYTWIEAPSRTPSSFPRKTRTKRTCRFGTLAQ